MRSIEAAWLEILPGRSVSSIVEEFTFHSCTALTSITGLEAVTSIGGNAFSWCTALTSVTGLEAVTSIGANAFKECTALTSVTGLASVTSIGNSAFCRSGLAGDFAWPVG